MTVAPPLDAIRAFIAQHAIPLEPEFLGRPFRDLLPTLEELRAEVRRQGLWAPHLPREQGGLGLSLPAFAEVSALLGESPIGHYLFNCQAPDVGNQELLLSHGTPAQRATWLDPLVRGEIRSCFAMTEPEFAGSNPVWMETRAVRDGDAYVITGHKWFTSSADGAAFTIVMAVTDPEAAPHRRASQIIVPMDAPGLTLVRNIPVMGEAGSDYASHAELRFDQVRVPVTNRLGAEGEGFALAQARLGPGRIHHCMRCIGMAERALELMCRRVTDRVAFGKPLAQQGVIQEWIADSRIEIEQARLLTLKAAWLMDTIGNKGARVEISAIKVVAPNVALRVVDRAIQAHGGGGVSQDFPLAGMWAGLRTLRFADGPDEVHRMQLARRELGRYADDGGR